MRSVVAVFGVLFLIGAQMLGTPALSSRWAGFVQIFLLCTIVTVALWRRLPDSQAWATMYVCAIAALPLPLIVGTIHVTNGSAGAAVPSAAYALFSVMVVIASAVQNNRARETEQSHPGASIKTVVSVAIATVVVAIPVSVIATDRALARWVKAQERSDAPELSEKGKTVIAVFTDYQCPACRTQREALRPIMEKLRSQAGQRLDIRTYNFPLDKECNPSIDVTLHPLACEEAALVETTTIDDTRLLLENFLFDHQASASMEELKALAARSGVGDTFEQAYSDGLSRVSRDVALGARLGVTGTPTYFVNGIKARGWSPELFEQIVRVELDK